MKHPWDPQLFSAGALAAGLDTNLVAAIQKIASNIKGINPDLPVVLSLSHLGHLVGVLPKVLHDIVDRKANPYRVFRLKKKKTHPSQDAAPHRRFRTICVPNPALMRAQRWIAQNILNAATPHAASFAFTPGRNLTGAADRHAGCRWLVKMDVRNFFESLYEPAIYRVFVEFGYSLLLSFELARLCTRCSPSGNAATARPPIGPSTLPYARQTKGHLPQGAPTSPMLANLAVRLLDERLSNMATAQNWRYTRYADDIAFSTMDACDRESAMKLVIRIKQELGRFGLEANQAKTRIAPPGSRRIVLGLQVDRAQPRLSRAFRNNLETHLYALRNKKIGVAAHRTKRGFASTIGMRRHIKGLIAFAHQVEPTYAQKLYGEFNKVDWSS